MGYIATYTLSPIDDPLHKKDCWSCRTLCRSYFIIPNSMYYTHEIFRIVQIIYFRNESFFSSCCWLAALLDGECATRWILSKGGLCKVGRMRSPSRILYCIWRSIVAWATFLLIRHFPSFLTPTRRMHTRCAEGRGWEKWQIIIIQHTRTVRIYYTRAGLANFSLSTHDIPDRCFIISGEHKMNVLSPEGGGGGVRSSCLARVCVV